MTVNLAQWHRLVRRFLTSAGNVIALPVTATATSIAVTFPRTEVDTAFGIAVTPNWLTTIAVTAKSVTGCTVSFGTAAPANASIDLATFRTE